MSLLSRDERRRHLALVDREQLASVMNQTKWAERAATMQGLCPLPDWRCKEIAASEPGRWDAEWYYHVRPFHTIEWLEIGFVHPKSAPGRHAPAPLTPAERAGAEARLRETLSALGVPFSLENSLVRVWGYTRPGAQPVWARSGAG
jgi:hypothetical protein